ncbi:MAG: N-acetylneuraminate synthase family protein [Kordiimonadaceae bacterium]|nr:N-acetylneuraminate synthase family protein [Kordiimonadaceae bacterium]
MKRVQKTYIIAEMAFSHDGSEIRALEIVEGAAASGANAISIHTTDMPSYMVQHYGSGPGRVSAGKDTQPIYDYLVEINPSQEVWERVVARVKSLGLDLVIMPNDSPSLAFSETLAPTAYVLSAAAFVDVPFVEELAGKGRPVYLRVGGATLGEIADAIALLRQHGAEDLTLLFGHQNYPTDVADTDLMFLACLKETFGLPVGLADHIDADDELATILPLMALPIGATVIEKHLTYDRSQKGEDHESALNPSELKTFIQRVRAAEVALGHRYADALQTSGEYRLVSRKRLVAARDLPKGHVLTEENLIAKRADEGACPSERMALIGQALAVDLSADQGVALVNLSSRA